MVFRRHPAETGARVTTLLAATVALTVPLGVSPMRVHGQPIFIFEIPLVLLFPVGVRLFLVEIRRGGQRRICVLPIGFLVFMALCLVALIAHPSVAGALLLARLGAGGALAWAVSRLPRRYSVYVAAALLAGAAVESVLALAQFVRQGPIGLSALGEGTLPLGRLADVFIPRGTFNHQYPLAAFCLLAAIVGAVTAAKSRHPWLWLLASVTAVAPLGLTFSRAAVLGLVLALIGMVWAAARHELRYGLVVLALALGFVVPASLARGGWTGRVYQTVHSPTVEAFSSGRVSMFHESVNVARANPVVGIGPARYAATRPPVNDVALLVADEAGIGAGLAVAVLVVLLGWRAWRTGSLASSLFASLVPFLLFDYFLYGIPQGPAIAGLWAGVTCSTLVRFTGPTVTALPGSRASPASLDAAGGCTPVHR